MKNNLLRNFLLITGIALAGLWACDEEDTIREVEVKGETVYDTVVADVPAASGSRILEYNIPTSEAPIYAAINDSTLTITVYLPFYSAIQVFVPEITLSEGASLQDEIEVVDIDLLPVTYTVIGSDSSLSTYTLDVYIQEPDLYVSTGADSTIILYDTDGFPDILGAYFIPSTDITKPYLVDGYGDTISMEADMLNGEIYSTLIPLFGDVSAYGTAEYHDLFPFEYDTAYYYYVECYSLSATSAYPVIIKREPVFNVDAFNTTIVVKQGDTFEWTGNTYLHDGCLTQFAIYQVGALEVVSINPDTGTIILRFPEDFPTGTYTARRLEYTTAYGGSTRTSSRNTSGMVLTVEGMN